MNTIYQKRAKVLDGKLALLNQFLTSESGGSFGDFLSKHKLNEGKFLDGLPPSFRLEGISGADATSENLKDFTEALSLMYANQYLQHRAAQQGILRADGESEDAMYWSKAIFHYAGGKEKKSLKEKLKDLKQDIKDGIKNTKDKLKDVKLKDVANVVNKANPAFVVMRNAFNGLVIINAFHFAKNLSRMRSEDSTRWNQVKNRWIVFGGNIKDFEHNIDKGKDKKAPLSGKGRGADGSYSVTGVDDTLALVASATPIISAIAPIIQGFQKSKGEKVDDVPAIDPNSIPADVRDAIGKVDSSGISLVDNSFLSKYKYWILGSLAVVVIGGTIYIMRKD